MPASFAWQQLGGNARLNGLPISVGAIEGTIWDGKALVRAQGLESIVHWSLGLPTYSRLSLPVEIELESDAGQAEAVLNIGVDTQKVTLRRAVIETEKLNGVLRPQRIKLAGELNINNLILELGDQQIKAASGKASWQGGTISYPAGPELHTRLMPAFFATIQQDSSGIKMGIRDESASFDVIDGLLTNDGIATMQVRKRLLDISGEYWPRKGGEQNVVFKVKRRIW